MLLKQRFLKKTGFDFLSFGFSEEQFAEKYTEIFNGKLHFMFHLNQGYLFEWGVLFEKKINF